jgi:hypothetical protein
MVAQDLMYAHRERLTGKRVDPLWDTDNIQQWITFFG